MKITRLCKSSFGIKVAIIILAIVGITQFFCGCNGIAENSPERIRVLYLDPSYKAVKINQPTKFTAYKQSGNGKVEQAKADEIEYVFSESNIADIEITPNDELVFKKAGRYEVRTKIINEKSTKGRFVVYAYDEHHIKQSAPIDFLRLDKEFTIDGDLIIAKDTTEKKGAATTGSDEKSGGEKSTKELEKEEKKESRKPADNDSGSGKSDRSDTPSESNNENKKPSEKTESFSSETAQKAAEAKSLVLDLGGAEITYSFSLNTKNYFMPSGDEQKLNFLYYPAIKIYKDGKPVSDPTAVSILHLDKKEGGLKDLHGNSKQSYAFGDKEYTCIIPAATGQVQESKMSNYEFEKHKFESPEFFIKNEEIKVIFTAKEEGNYEVVFNVFKDSENGILLYSQRDYIEVKP